MDKYMISNSEILYEYEEILCGKRALFSIPTAGLPISELERITGVVWKYAITEILHWSADDALNYLTPDIVSLLKMDVLYAALKLSRRNFDYRYLLSKAFPKEIKYDERTRTIEEYEHVLGIGKWNGSEYQFRKKFFTSDGGSERASICLAYAINHFLEPMTMTQLYAFFADTVNANKWLKKMNLKNVAKLLHGDPLTYFHYSIGHSQRDYFLYYNYMFNREYAEIAANNKVNI